MAPHLPQRMRRHQQDVQRPQHRQQLREPRPPLHPHRPRLRRRADPHRLKLRPLAMAVSAPILRRRHQNFLRHSAAHGQGNLSHPQTPQQPPHLAWVGLPLHPRRLLPPNEVGCHTLAAPARQQPNNTMNRQAEPTAEKLTSVPSTLPSAVRQSVLNIASPSERPRPRRRGRLRQTDGRRSLKRLPRPRRLPKQPCGPSPRSAVVPWLPRRPHCPPSHQRPPFRHCPMRLPVRRLRQLLLLLRGLSVSGPRLPRLLPTRQ